MCHREFGHGLAAWMLMSPSHSQTYPSRPSVHNEAHTVHTVSKDKWALNIEACILIYLADLLQITAAFSLSQKMQHIVAFWIEAHQQMCWLDDHLWMSDMFLFIYFNGTISHFKSSIRYNLGHPLKNLTVCCKLKWMHALLSSQQNPDPHQRKLFLRSHYAWSNLSSTAIWCAWGVCTTSSVILPEEEGTVSRSFTATVAR